VLADRQRLKQVLLNLLTNAIKYNRPGGRVTVRCETRAGSEAGTKMLRLSVSDTGAGISPSKLELLFVPFERLGADQTAVEGTGLGLVLAKRMVELMGGTLGVESAVGEGSTFWVELPITEAPPGEEGALVEIGGVHMGAPSTAKHKLVYIEDNLPNLRLVERILARRSDIELIPAMQGRLGLDLVREHLPDLVLLDLNLPDLTGQEVLARLRADPRTRALPVLIISADATPGQIERLRSDGALDYLTKPLDIRKFLAVVDAALAGRAVGPDEPHGLIGS
jgi:CheY-like chemotaxis protein